MPETQTVLRDLTRWDKVPPGSVTDAFCLWFPVQCNNPKTKEPKLTAAARIVPEWVEYDEEIKKLLRRIQEGADAAVQKQTPSRHKKGEGRVKNPPKISAYSDLHVDLSNWELCFLCD